MIARSVPDFRTVTVRGAAAGVAVAAAPLTAHHDIGFL
jgi:hypothetical protein